MRSANLGDLIANFCYRLPVYPIKVIIDNGLMQEFLLVIRGGSGQLANQ